ncbi:MAG: energy-coupling factor transport system permease protein [Chloroflexota bacterium]|nr:energy-coupling factor transport system permease protein [Chloroflexota bacterium]
MNIAPRYLGRGSWLARRDPRVLILAIVLFIFTVLQVWDGRVIFGLLVISVAYYSLAGIPWRQIRRNWTVVFVFIGLLVTVNMIIGGGDAPGVTLEQAHVLFRIPLLGAPISAESLSLAVTQLMRYLAMATIGFPLAFAVAPADFGVAFHRLGVPEKFAFGIDLTFRFLPSLANDLQTTADAQRIRGFDWSAGKAGFLSRVRSSVPVVVPTVVNAIAGAEDTIDAMDLRGFGTGRRTWLRHLAYDRTDLAVIGFFMVLLVVATIGGFSGAWSQVWTPQLLIDLAPG